MLSNGGEGILYCRHCCRGLNHADEQMTTKLTKFDVFGDDSENGIRVSQCRVRHRFTATKMRTCDRCRENVDVGREESTVTYVAIRLHRADGIHCKICEAMIMSSR